MANGLMVIRLNKFLLSLQDKRRVFDAAIRSLLIITPRSDILASTRLSHQKSIITKYLPTSSFPTLYSQRLKNDLDLQVVRLHQ